MFHQNCTNMSWHVTLWAHLLELGWTSLVPLLITVIAASHWKEQDRKDKADSHEWESQHGEQKPWGDLACTAKSAAGLSLFLWDVVVFCHGDRDNSSKRTRNSNIHIESQQIEGFECTKSVIFTLEIQACLFAVTPTESQEKENTEGLLKNFRDTMGSQDELRKSENLQAAQQEKSCCTVMCWCKLPPCGIAGLLALPFAVIGLVFAILFLPMRCCDNRDAQGNEGCPPKFQRVRTHYWTD